MIEAGVGVDCDYAVKDEADESERIRDIFLALMAVRQEDILIEGNQALGQSAHQLGPLK